MDEITLVKYKECDGFYHPMSGSLDCENYNIDYEHQCWLQIGSMQIPEYPINSITEAYYQLKKVVGIPFYIHSRWYRTQRYIVGLDCEKISGAGFTGLNAKAGDLLTINFRNCWASGVGNSTPHRVYCALHYDAVLNIRDSGIELLD